MAQVAEVHPPGLECLQTGVLAEPAPGGVRVQIARGNHLPARGVVGAASDQEHRSAGAGADQARQRACGRTVPGESIPTTTLADDPALSVREAACRAASATGATRERVDDLGLQRDRPGLVGASLAPSRAGAWTAGDDRLQRRKPHAVGLMGSLSAQFPGSFREPQGSDHSMSATRVRSIRTGGDSAPPHQQV